MLKNVNKKKILAIIPARKGSKRLKNKNILRIQKKPLFAWTLDLAISCKLFTDIYVSTDSIQILKYAKKKNCICPALRKKKLSGSNITLIKVCVSILKYLKKIERSPDTIVLLQPTSPFRTKELIERGLKKFHSKINKNRNSLVSIARVSKHPLQSFKKDKIFMRPYLANNKVNLQSQNLNDVFAPTGSLYIADAKKFLKEKTFFSNKTMFIETKYEYENLDVDEKYDFELAKAILKYGKEKFKNI